MGTNYLYNVHSYWSFTCQTRRRGAASYWKGDDRGPLDNKDEDAADQAFAFSTRMHKEFRKMANVVKNQVTSNYYMADLTKPALARLQFTATW